MVDKSEEEYARARKLFSDISPTIKCDGKKGHLYMDTKAPKSFLQVVTSKRDHKVLFLPPHRVSSDGYPTNETPLVSLEAGWLRSRMKKEVEAEVAKVWKDNGNANAEMWPYLMHLFQLMESKLRLKLLVVEEEALEEIIRYNSEAPRQYFERMSHECGVYLTIKPGTEFHRMERCSHIFCVSCLKQGYHQMIKEGDIDNFKCMGVNCGTKNLDASARPAHRVRLVSPRELLKIPIDREMVERFVQVKREKRLEADPSTIWCPLQECKGAAKGNSHPRPIKTMCNSELAGYSHASSDVCTRSLLPLEELEASDSEDGLVRDFDKRNLTYKFCKKCQEPYHEIEDRCFEQKRKREAEEKCRELEKLRRVEKDQSQAAIDRRRAETNVKMLQYYAEKRRRQEEQASLDYIATQTSPCPNCATPVSKIDACNHITCRTCRTHFCYLCSSRLDPRNLYKHFSIPGTPCHNKSWVLCTGGDESSVQFHGIRGDEISVRHLESKVKLLERKGRIEEAQLLEAQKNGLKAELEESRAKLQRVNVP